MDESLVALAHVLAVTGRAVATAELEREVPALDLELLSVVVAAATKHAERANVAVREHFAFDSTKSKVVAAILGRFRDGAWEEPPAELVASLASVLRAGGGSYFTDARVERAFGGHLGGERITAAFIRTKGPRESARCIFGALVEASEGTMRRVGKVVAEAAPPRHPIASGRAAADDAARLALRLLGVPDEHQGRLIADIERAAIDAHDERDITPRVALLVAAPKKRAEKSSSKRPAPHNRRG